MRNKVLICLMMFCSNGYSYNNASDVCPKLFDFFEEEKTKEYSDNLNLITNFNNDGLVPEHIIDVAVVKDMVTTGRLRNSTGAMKLVRMAPVLVNEYFIFVDSDPQLPSQEVEMTTNSKLETLSGWIRSFFKTQTNQSEATTSQSDETLSESDVENLLITWTYWIQTSQEIVKGESFLDLRGEFLGDILKPVSSGIGYLNAFFPNQSEQMEVLQNYILEVITSNVKEGLSNPVVFFETLNIIDKIFESGVPYNQVAVEKILQLLIKSVSSSQRPLMYDFKKFVTKHAIVVQDAAKKIRKLQTLINSD